MTEVRFYHVQRDVAAKALPALLSKAMSKGMKIMVKTPDAARRDYYDHYLWRFDPAAFLPHGQEGDSFPDQQPIWLTTQDQAPNEATVAIALEGVELPPLHNFQMVCTLFDNESETTLQQVRQQWKALKEQANLELTYWKQELNGAWVKQAI
jgi:DNA polymerase-3 subunit chi